MPKDTALHKACHKGDIGSVEDLLAAGEDPNAKGASNRTPLHKAVGKGNNDIVELLLEKKAEVEKNKDAGGLTPLHWAAMFGLVDTANILLEFKANPNTQTKTGETCLHLAAEKGKVEFVKLMLEHDANPDLFDKGPNGGSTAYDAAKKAGQKEVMALLQPAGSDGCCVIV